MSMAMKTKMKVQTTSQSRHPSPLSELQTVGDGDVGGDDKVVNGDDEEDDEEGDEEDEVDGANNQPISPPLPLSELQTTQ